ncbi:MAG: FecR family protein [Treponema sp.]|nr:FecR family protein [Treponema sp.]
MKRLTVFILLFQCACFIFAQSPQAVIREVNGTVELKGPTAAGWTPAQAGQSIERDAVISTGFRSMALLAIGNSTITVRPLTRLSLNEIIAQESAETVSLGLRTGRIQVAVNPPAGTRTNFSVQSPSATASVRGTSFEMDPLNIRVTEGSVFYEAANGTVFASVMVGAGQKTWVDPDAGRAVNPFAAAEAARKLPPLTGGDTAGADTAAKPDFSRETGTLEIGDIILIPAIN